MPYRQLSGNTGECEKVDDPEVDKLFQKVRKLNNKYYIEEETHIVGLRKRKLKLYTLLLHCVGAEYALISPIGTVGEYSVPKEIMVSFLCGMLEAYVVQGKIQG